MAKLTAAARNKIPGGEFALPGRRYPIEDPGHAKAARARVDEFGTPVEKKTVFSKTSKFFKKKKPNFYGE
jgi:hypothetical protein